ncbi:hypothetical protein ACIHCQ_42305 [Streptomyces sp. NPDC052236]|uniref:hypothetical protein n=1 Tax=Streptomyces sp. NPDC052236 TaxID=3365686 RepID=UPI0037D72A87
MLPELFRPADPASGYHRIICERRFRYLEQDPAHTIRIKWLAQDLACPICKTDTGLQLVLEEGVDHLVRAYCPTRPDHAWVEPRIQRIHFATYSRLQLWAEPDPEWLWIIDAGFGEESPPPIDYAKELAAATKYVAKYAKRKAKSKAKQAVRKQSRRAGRGMKKAAMVPVAAALRAAWAWQAGGVPETKPKPKAEPEPAIPSIAKYRNAYGVTAPKRGPKCLVCEDTGSIPGTAITCTECAGPAAAAMAAAERRAERARQGKGPQSKPKAGKTGGKSVSTVRVSGENNSVITNTTSGDVVQEDRPAETATD